ncbi:unnamed protein product [Brachionus calyciflorus]|uniref:Uncharacterized protein n=1 Tax=Brachionus calyciflorus TaxID=104777 RepID=A0A813PX96_9BILA|nr:unnamed protein product [Brachionus calyciflorus]
MKSACVNEIKQSDGSVVKEYILNDPKVIEQIRTQMKTNPPQNQTNANTSIKKCQNQPNIEGFSPLPSMSSTITPSTPYINQVKQQIQKFQQTTPPPPPPPLPIPVIPKPVKHFEYKTKKGKLIRLTVNGEDITESDCEELRSVLTIKEPEVVKNEIQKNFAFQPKNTQMIKSGSLDNILDSKPAVSRIIPTGQKSNLPVYLNYLNQTKSINKLEQKTTNLSNTRNESSSKSQENLNEDSYFKKVSINQTYTKSTRPNFKYPIIDDAKKLSNNLNSVKKLNKSMDNLDSLDSKEKPITPEMTEQLLLKLLLHQIALQKEEKEKKKIDEDDDRTSLSNDTFSSSSSQSKSKSITNQRMVGQSGQVSVNRNNNNNNNNGQNISSDLAKNKKMLGQKSMSNFNNREVQEDSDDDFESLIHNKNMNQFNAARNKLRQNFF